MQTDRISLDAHAKINLTLGITGRRADGYHEVEMLMQSISLCDRVQLSLTQKAGIWLTCDNPALPTDEKNLAYRAAALLLDKIGCDRGVQIAIEKRIPTEAGLAGGSADAAAVLLGLNRLLGAPLTPKALAECGLSLGADVPFCLSGGTQLAQGIGEVLQVQPALPPCHIVLVKPPVSASTAAIYQAYDATPAPKQPDTAAMQVALAAGSLTAVAEGLCNVLEPVTAALHAEIDHIRQALLQNGARGARMTGSGSVVFGLFADEGTARQAAAAVESFGQVFCAVPQDSGICVV